MARSEKDKVTQKQKISHFLSLETPLFIVMFEMSAVPHRWPQEEIHPGAGTTLPANWSG